MPVLAPTRVAAIALKGMLQRSMHFRRSKHCGRPNRTMKDGLLHDAPSAKRRGMLIIDDLTVRIAGRTLLKGASARIPTGARVGLVGRRNAANAVPANGFA